jgi:hypothetical protein
VSIARPPLAGTEAGGDAPPKGQTRVPFRLHRSYGRGGGPGALARRRGTYLCSPANPCASARFQGRVEMSKKRSPRFAGASGDGASRTTLEPRVPSRAPPRPRPPAI